MTPVELSRTVLHAVRRAVDAGELSVSVPERVVVKPPGPGGCGDYATTVALQLARPAGQSALRVAGVLRDRLVLVDGIQDVSVTGPGFLNISLREDQAGAASVRLVSDILRSGPSYGYGEGASIRSPRVLLRCAAEPRALVVGEVLARLLAAQGSRARVEIAGESEGQGDGDRRVAVPDADDRVIDVRPLPVAPADRDALLSLGHDAGRWALLYPAGRDRVRVGGEHLAQRESNPLFRVRYAHARTRALLRNAADLGFAPEPGPTHTPEPGDTSTTGRTDTADSLRPLLTALADHPRVLAQAAAHRAPDRLARQLVAVADGLWPLLPTVLPVGEEKPSAAHRARLALAEAAGTVLAGGLSLLGIDAPDHL
ncbi:ArgS-related anticodon-binding protein NrtL [Streptomyces sp. NPDC004042]|uniref:ArgS-related anticodon-binding protein NrtL n=1 Tax=Streptomyces sp. NPDC004042 TaxID=3154451 RepID=UPI0033ADB243